MSFSNSLVRVYFDLVYNPIYDMTTAQLDTYRWWQERCISKFSFEKNDSMLCVGIGTGNEIPYIIDGNREIDIVGVDTSERALKKAYQKGSKLGQEIEVLQMDAQELQYPAESFNKVLCLHVMDFIEDDEQATREIFRVLKKGGQFVITYPLNKEGVKLGASLIGNAIRSNIDSGKYFAAFPQIMARTGLGLLYLPLLLRAKQRFYSYHEIETMFNGLKLGEFQIEEYPSYSDFIISGRK